MSITREDIQTKIDSIKGIQASEVKNALPLSEKDKSNKSKREQLKSNLSSWLDTQDLTSLGLSQEFVKQRILEDFDSYEGVQ